MRRAAACFLFFAYFSLHPAGASVRHSVFGLDPGTTYNVFQGGTLAGDGLAPSIYGSLTFVTPLASPVVIVATGVATDLLSPGPPLDLRVLSVTDRQARLSWIAPGDDGAIGTAAAYDLRMSTDPITSGNFLSATEIGGEPSPRSPASRDSLTVSGLALGETYYFALRARDERFNWSPISNVVEATTTGASEDVTPPSRVTDLIAIAAGGSAVALSWTAPGDDGMQGTASAYDIRASTSPIDATNFAAASPVTPMPSPSAAGAAETVTIGPLTVDTRYYFALKTADEVPNWSSLSAVATVSTSGPPDTIPPGNISGIHLSRIGHRFVNFSWVAPWDNGGRRAAAYEGRLAGRAFTSESDWLEGAVIHGLPRPSVPGARDSVRIDGLAPAQRYYLALRTRDAAGNISALGPQLAFTTTSAPDTLPPETIQSLGIVSATWTTLRVQWTAPADSVPEDCALPPEVERYELRYGPWPPPEDLWTGGQQAVAGRPAAPGTVEETVITGLEPGVEYFVAIRSRDARGLWSGASNIAAGLTLAGEPTDDVIPPEAVTDLAATAAPGPIVILSWTAPADDGPTGRATAYDLRASTEPITPDNFDSCTVIATAPAPAAPGTPQELSLSGFHPNVSYYFALVSADERPNWSALSNVASVTATGTADLLSPDSITDLVARNVAHRSAALAWSAPADPGSGEPEAYEGRIAEHEIYSELAWQQARPIEGLPLPSAAGSRDSVVIAGLDPARRYHAVVRARDRAGNIAPLDAGVAFVTTSAPDTLPPESIETLSIASATSATLRVRWLAPRDSVPDDCVEEPRVERYELRYGPWPPPEDVWSLGLEAATGPPGPPGATEEVLIAGLTPASEYFFAIRASDAHGRWSRSSNILKGTTALPIFTGDSTPPAAAAGLAAAAVSYDTVVLTWIAPGDDGDLGQAEYYDVRRATRPLTAELWPTAIRVMPTKTCAAAGAPETLRVAGLQPERTYHFALRAIDPEGNIGPLSASVSARTPAAPDTVGPRTVTDLSAAVIDSVTALLTWTAPLDEHGACGGYEMRRSPEPIDETSWENATLIQGLPVPAAPGEAESLLVTELPRESLVVFALRTEDASGNWSPISNLCPVVTDSTETGPPDSTADRKAPAAIADLGAVAIDPTHVRLTWTAVGDDSLSGTATFYEGRRSSAPIDSTGWAAALPFDIPFQPHAAGTPETLLVAGLEPATSYCFALRARDDSGNLSPLAAGGSVTTPQTQDVTAPATPAEIIASQSGEAVVLTWAPPGDGDISGYIVYRRAPNGAADPAFAPLEAARGYRDTTVAPESEYIYAVAAVDTAENHSPRSVEVRIKTAIDGFLPVVSGLEVSAPIVETRAGDLALVRLAWACRTGERFAAFRVDGRDDGSMAWQRRPETVLRTVDQYETAALLEPGRFWFRIVAVSPRGYETELCQFPVDVAEPVSPPPPPLHLGAPYPNPTPGAFSLRASTPAPIALRVRLFDARSRLCAVVFDGIVSAGEHSWTWDPFAETGRKFASGVYYLETQFGPERRVRKIVVQR